MKDKLIIKLLSVLCVLIFAFVFSCSPQKRLDRLTKNNPELMHPDTTFKYGSIHLPGVNMDTTVAANTDTRGVADIIDRFKAYIDSVTRAKLQAQITTYITERPCLKDTFRVDIDGGYVKLYQDHNGFHYIMQKPPQDIRYRQAIITNHFNVTNTHNWVMFWIGLCVIPIIGLVLYVVSKYFKL